VISITLAWREHAARVVADRDDGRDLHSSDLHSCAYALQQRLQGVPQLPNDDGSFANFERGHAFEDRMETWLRAYALRQGLLLTRGEQVTHAGIVGNLDFVLYASDAHDRKALAIIDCSTTAGKTTDWSYGHTLKSAFYAVAKGCDAFAEFVVRIGFGGAVLDVGEHWFLLSEEFEGVSWAERVRAAIEDAHAVAACGQLAPQPPWDPVDQEFEEWRCGREGSGKSYCRARCPRNQRLSAAERAALVEPAELVP
jgi:hypothetical protein